MNYCNGVLLLPAVVSLKSYVGTHSPYIHQRLIHIRTINSEVFKKDSPPRMHNPKWDKSRKCQQKYIKLHCIILNLGVNEGNIVVP